jgi:uncharacterized protein with GYD domain
MATYVMFGRYTMEGMKGITAERTSRATALLKKYGGEIKAGYALLGKDDLLLITEFPSAEQALKGSLALAKLTGISLTTSPAVTMAEFDKLAADT